jgi:phage major head subunit gpT-like protein
MLTPADLQAFFTQLDMRYHAGYAAREIFWQYFCELCPSSTESKVYSWLAELPRMRKWIGAKQVDNIVARAYTLINEDWEETFEVDRNKIEDDEAGIYAQRAQLQGDVVASWPDDMMTTTLINGTTQAGYDEQYFFDTDHPVDLSNSAFGTYSNYNINTPLTQANYAAKKAQMRKVKGESGKPLGVKPTVMMVGPDLEMTAKEITGGELIARAVTNVAGAENVAAASISNVYKGDVLLVVNERLVDDAAGAWYLFSTNRVKPLIFQLRKAPERKQVIDPQNPLVFNSRKLQYGVEARGTGGYALPFLAQKNIAGAS